MAWNDSVYVLQLFLDFTSGPPFDAMAACAANCMRCNMCTSHIGQRMRMACVGRSL